MTPSPHPPGAPARAPLLALDALDPERIEALLEDEEVAEDRGDEIVCAACRWPITSSDERIERGGSHDHAFTNPAGYEYYIGLFGAAPGCRAEGSSTEAWTWFPGYAWRVVACAGCGKHLGWVYSPPGTGEGFHGLILDRLVAEERS